MLAAAKVHTTEQNQVIELCRVLFQQNGESGLRNALKIVKGLTDDPESIRYAVLGYAKSVMVSGRDMDKAYIVISAFKDNFYDSKMAGVVASLYEVFLGE